MSGTVDELIVCLMSMGFELKDCQDAIQFGKVTVEEAVEWIVAGKPGFSQTQSTASLKLFKGTSQPEVSAGPYVAPHPIQSVDMSPAPQELQGQSHIAHDPGGSAAHGAEAESTVVSRMHLDDKQRRVKEHFEQKQRDEAKKEAQKEKQKQKQEHARILKEIAEDREKQKLKIKSAGGTSSNESSQPGIGSPSRSGIGAPTGTFTPQSESDKCLIQIRFPNGKTVRQQFSSTSSLRDVWNFASQQITGIHSMALMQPFPRREYDHKDMTVSLCELGLSPSGSLVLQRKESTQTVAPQMEVEAVPDVSDDTNVERNENKDNQEGVGWGRGYALAHNMAAAAEDRAGAEAMDEDVDEGMEDGLMDRMGQMFPQGVMGGPQILGGFPGRRMMDAASFQGLGQRLVSMGDPQFNAAHHHRPAREVAAERARERFAHPVEQHDVVVEAAVLESRHHSGTHSVNSLLLLCLQQVGHGLNDPRVPLLSLSGMSEELAQKMLEHLIKEKQLKPKTLNVFISCHLRKLILDCYAYTTNELLHAVRLHTNLSHLSLSSCPLITDTGLQDLTALKKLKVLNLSCCQQLSNKCLPFLVELKCLTSLNLEDTGVNDTGLEGYLASCPHNLQHLILNKTAVTHQIITALQGLPMLKSLYLEQTKVCSLSGVQELKSLETLDVSHTDIMTDSLLCVSSHLSMSCLGISHTENVNGDLALQYITGLKLQAVNLPSRHTTTNRGLSYITGWHLTTLDLSNYINITDEGMQYVGMIHSLKRLLLSNTKVSDEGMVYLQGLRCLEVFYLDRTLVTDTGVSVISAFTHLSELSLSSTSVTSQFLLAGVLNSCQDLTRLNLSRTGVTSKGVMNLKLPCLTLLNLDGTRVRPDMAHHIPACPSINRVMVANLLPMNEDDM